MNYGRLEELAAAAGFQHSALLDVSTVELHEEVRKMCEADTCGKYGRSWSCPPGCGTLSECEEKIRRFQKGILVQTVGDLEDEFDGEGMMEAQKRYQESFRKLAELLRTECPGHLAFSAGACTLCEKCTYPGQPCRFPGKAVSSMEANGMLVLEVCKRNGLTYYYGPEKIAYTGCFLIE